MIHRWLGVAKNRSVMIVSFLQASQYYVYGSIEFFLVGYMNEIVKLDSLLIGIVMGIQVVAIIIVRPFMGRMSDKIGRRTPIILGILISFPAVLAFPYSTQFLHLILLSIIYGIGYAMVISSTSPLVSELVPRNLLGTAMGFISTMMDIGQTLGPIISGLILGAGLQYVGLFSSLSLLLIFSDIIFVLSGIQKSGDKAIKKS